MKELKKYPDYFLLSEYAKLKEKGLRKEALNALDKFILLAQDFSEIKKRHLVRLICHIHTQCVVANDFLTNSWEMFNSYLLSQKIILPTLKQWIEDEPLNTEPLKLAALFYYCEKENLQPFLEKALALNPQDNEVKNRLILIGDAPFLEKFLEAHPTEEEARRNLIFSYLGDISFSTHHLISDSFYIGDPIEDLKLCDTIDAHIKNLSDDNKKETFSQRLQEYRQLIEDYGEYEEKKVEESFEEWLYSKYNSAKYKPSYKKINSYYYKSKKSKSTLE